ncbi:MAG: hypothetical protein CVU71_03570 [Deltaproteobacteria bacterium HGW-Deltaproteobacteria-6]|nr:MAG: hypothetical protein CVU71_03570 [Deltaproteobacteria bacterium HGW-Deltaproteobacteria-6]
MNNQSVMNLHLLTLKFSGDSADLEKPFQREYFRASLPHNRAALIIGLLFYSAFGILDLLLMPEHKSTIWLIRFAVVGPALIGTFLLSFSRSFQWYINPLMTFVSLVAGGGIIWMVFIAPQPVNYYYYAGVMLVFIWTYTFVRIPFLWASFAGWVLVVLYEISAIWISPTPFSVLINNNFFFISANVMGMIACYSLEYYARRNFFLMQQTETDRERINCINRELESRTVAYQIVNRTLEEEIDERKKMEKKLRDSEEFFREITINSSDVLFIINGKGSITYVSPSVERIVGYRPDELIGKNSFDLIIPEDHSRAGKDFGMALLTKEVSIPNNFRIRHKNGAELIMEGIGKNLLDNPVIAGFVMNVRDVTDRKRTEESLKETEQRFRLITDNVRDSVWLMDMNLRTNWISPSAEHKRGFTLEELQNLSLEQHLSPQSLQTALALIEKNLTPDRLANHQEDISIKAELEFYRKDGSTMWADTVITLLRDGQGIPAGFVGLSRDTTERREMEEALRENEKKYRLLTEKMTDIVWIADMNLRTLYVTPSVQTVLGFTQEERMRQTIDQQFTPDSLFFGLEAMARELTLEAQGQGDPERKAVLVLEYYHKDGSTRWMETVITGLRNDQGVLTGLHGVSRDVTARKKAEDALQKSEKRYRTIFESTATANIIIAEDTTILMANDNFANLCGYPKNELEGKMSWTVFIHPDDLQKMKTYHKIRRVDSALAPSSYEFRFLNRKGEMLYLFISIAVIPETKESIASLVDLTGRKQLEVQLTQAQKMESVGRLAGGVAHDFNNMLSVIIGNTEMAMNKIQSSEPLYRSLQEIMNAGMRSADLTRQLLAFARKQTISPKVLDLNDTVTGMLKMLQRLIGENIDLVWHPGHNLWKVRIDPSQLDQLLANLAVNARDAIDKTGRITIETANTTCDAAYCMDQPECIPGAYILLVISDNGCGMDKETLANIFEPFFTTKKEGQGTGLGLATVYGIVKQNNGFINVYSEPGQGTTFRIYLPRCMDKDMEANDDQQEPEIQGGHETILIVEDEETVLKLSKNMLELLGYKVLAAGSKDQALQLAREHSHDIDLLLTDVVMPNINGKELSELIIAIKPGLKRLFMSGYTADVIALQGVLDEGVKFISKPFTLKDLATRVREVLG